MLYHRGTAADHDGWEAAGAEGWGAEEVLPYYRMHEDYQGGESQYHGIGGEQSVQEVPYQNPLAKAFLKAAGQMGFRANPDFNDWSAPQEGFGRYKVMQRDGERCSTQRGFLAHVQDRANLVVRTGAHVTKLVSAGKAQPTVTSVEFTDLDGTEVLTAKLSSTGEALLCAGSIQTPQILMLSGIGPRDHLEAKGIPVLKDLAGVGEGLQDHPAVIVTYECTKKVCLTDAIRLAGTGITNPLTLAHWLFAKKGPLTSVACDHGGFFRTSPDLEQPDLQVRFIPARAQSPSGMGTLVKYSQGVKLPSGFTTQLIACRPRSSGRVRLRTKNPLAKPLVEDIYLSADSDADIVALREGIKLARKLSGTEAFDEYRGEEVFPGTAVRTDDEIDAYVRSSIHSANALTSSCRMGSADDPMAVLDSELRVRGVRGLRVVDASAMPQIIGGQTAAPTLMVAEKAAHMILQKRTSRAHSAHAVKMQASAV